MSTTKDALEGSQFYLELCGYADQGLQFAYGLMLNRDRAIDIVNESYELFSRDLPMPKAPEKVVQIVLGEIWNRASSSSVSDPTQLEHKLFGSVLPQLSLAQRAATILRDHFGVPSEDIVTLLGISHEDYLLYLAQGRLCLVEHEF